MSAQDERPEAILADLAGRLGAYGLAERAVHTAAAAARRDGGFGEEWRLLDLVEGVVDDARQVAVAEARHARPRWSWQAIADARGVSKQTAHSQYSQFEQIPDPIRVLLAARRVLQAAPDPLPALPNGLVGLPAAITGLRRVLAEDSRLEDILSAAAQVAGNSAYHLPGWPTSLRDLAEATETLRRELRGRAPAQPATGHRLGRRIGRQP